jgi:hypothetical protein
VRNRTRLALAVLVATGTWAAQVAAGDVHYRWLNDRGQPVYSDRPPPQGVDYEVVSTSSTFKRAVSADEGAVPLEVESRVGNEFEQINTADKGPGKNPELCARARQDLEALTSADQVKVRNDQGEVRLLSPEEMQIERVRAQEQVKVYCD